MNKRKARNWVRRLAVVPLANAADRDASTSLRNCVSSGCGSEKERGGGKRKGQK